jgi:hypothetical protein
LAPQAREDRLDALARTGNGEVVQYGRSVQGRPLRALRLPMTRGASLDGSDNPVRVLCSANIHGVEFIGGLIALALAERAIDDPVVSRLRQRAELWVIACLNPDGYARTWENDGRGPLALLRTNGHGVDLNRNFPRPKLPSIAPWGSGSDRPGAATYRGPSPLSEPETAALDALCRVQRFHASVNVHSFMGTIIPARVTDRPSFAAYRELCGALVAAQPSCRYVRLSHRIVDVFTGEQEDHQHHVLQTWAICLETFPWYASLSQHWKAPSTFWRFNPRQPQRWIDNDVPAIVAFFEAALARPRPAVCPALELSSGP